MYFFVGGSVKWCNYYGNQVWRFLKKLKIDLCYDPAITLLDIYLKEYKSIFKKDTCISMFIRVSFTMQN
jgi:hypothetical protein